MAATCITRLPTEIVTSIARELLPRDLESFILTCRDIHLASGSVLEEHRVLQQRYRHTSTGLERYESAPPKVYHSLPGLLKTVLREPRIAAHIEHLSLIQQSEDPFNFNDDPDVSLKDALDSLNISRSEYQRGWFEGEDRSEEQLAGGLLLQHLFDLETFHWCSSQSALQLTTLLRSRLPPQTDVNRPRLSNLERFYKIQSPQADSNPRLLPALKKVILDVPEKAHEPQGNIVLQQIIPFLALPSIESLDITSFKYSAPPDDGNPTIALVRHGSSNLRELALSRSSLSEALDHLLRLPRSLRRLTFVAPVSAGSRAPHEIFPLGRLRLHDLERLTLRMRRWHDHIDRQALPGIYRKLVFLETNVFLTDNATVSPVGQIKHYFPPSVQHLVFADCRFETQMDIFVYFRQTLELRRAGILPDLMRLTLRSDRVRLQGFEMILRRTEQECAAEGVDFDVDFDWERPIPDSPAAGRIPVSWWRRSHEGYSTIEVDDIEGQGQPYPHRLGLQDYH